MRKIEGIKRSVYILTKEYVNVGLLPIICVSVQVLYGVIIISLKNSNKLNRKAGYNLYF